MGDHAIYFRGAQNITVVGNHLRGLQNGPAGGFKFKSGRNITIMNNYLRNTGLIMYGTPEIGLAETQAEGAISELSNWLVANNILIGSIGTINMQLEWSTIDIQEITMCSMAYLSTISLLTTIIFRKIDVGNC